MRDGHWAQRSYFWTHPSQPCNHLDRKWELRSPYGKWLFRRRAVSFFWTNAICLPLVGLEHASEIIHQCESTHILSFTRCFERQCVWKAVGSFERCLFFCKIWQFLPLVKTLLSCPTLPSRKFNFIIHTKNKWRKNLTWLQRGKQLFPPEIRRHTAKNVDNIN